MLPLHPSREDVYLVTHPIPDPLHPGHLLADVDDELIVEITNPDYPVSILRRLSVESLLTVPETSVRHLASYVVGSDDPVSAAPASSVGAHVLTLLRPA